MLHLGAIEEEEEEEDRRQNYERRCFKFFKHIYI
jgi:hypothetical protein